MIVNKEKCNFLPIKNWEEYYVVADFDRTITTGSSKTSWSVLASSDLVPEEYKSERDKLYDIYRPIEIDESMDFEKRSHLVKEWFRLHIELFVKYRIEEKLFEYAACDLRVMEFRKGAREFLEFLHERRVPVIIISAGIGNFIEHFLKKNECYYDNIHVCSNKIIFKDGIAIGVEDNIIHSLNKNEVELPNSIKEKLKTRDKIILLGDQIGDLDMVNEEKRKDAFKVGFITDETVSLKEKYSQEFDCVIIENDDYDDLLNLLLKGEN